MDSNVATMSPEAGTSSEGGSSRQAQADAANRASLEAAFDRVEAREKAVERQPVIHDAFREKAKTDRVIAEWTDYRAEGLPVYQNGTGVTVLDSLNAAADRAEAREAAREARRMPPSKEGTSTRERLEASQRWSELSDENKRDFRAGFNEAAQRRKSAEFFGLSLEEATAIEAEAGLRERDKVAPLMEKIRQLEPNKDPAAVAAWYRDVHESFKRDPKGTYRELGKSLGLVREPTPEQRQQFAQRAAQARQTAVLKGRAVHAIDSFASRCPDFGALEDGMVRALQSGRLQRSGDPMRDLHAAYRACGGRYA